MHKRKGNQAKVQGYKGAQLESEGNKELEQMHMQANSITYKTTRKMMEPICIHVKYLGFSQLIFPMTIICRNPSFY